METQHTYIVIAREPVSYRYDMGFVWTRTQYDNLDDATDYAIDRRLDGVKFVNVVRHSDLGVGF